jgi:hypothetical protein
MKTCYIKVTCHDLPPAVAVSIYTTVELASGAEATARNLNSVAKRKNIKASYEVATREEYANFRESQRAHIADKAQAVVREIQS